MYTYKARITRIVDGDTLDAEIDVGFNICIKERIRLARIDAPETYGVKKESEEYKAGMLAVDFVKDWLDKNKWEVVVKTNKDNKGKYGRYIAEVYKLELNEQNEIIIQDVSLNEDLLNKGLAVLYD